MQRPVNQATGQLYRIVSGKIVIDVCQYGDIALDRLRQVLAQSGNAGMQRSGQLHQHPFAMLFFIIIDEEIVVIQGILGKNARSVGIVQTNIPIAILEMQGKVGLIVHARAVIHLLQSHKFNVWDFRKGFGSGAAAQQKGQDSDQQQFLHLIYKVLIHNDMHAIHKVDGLLDKLVHVGVVLHKRDKLTVGGHEILNERGGFERAAEL